MESVLALALLAAIGVGVAQAFSSERRDLKLALVASSLGEVRAAADRYIRDNFAAVESAASAGPVPIALATLSGNGYLPASFAPTNAYQQQYYIYVRRRAPGVLESIVTTAGGQALSTQEGGKVATLLKGQGGFVPVSSPTILGTKGSWSLPVSSIVPGGSPAPSGNPVAYSLIRKFDGPSGALMRDDTGNPADNRMGTDLDMAGHRILNVKDMVVGGQIVNNTTFQGINDLAGISCGSGEALTKVGSTLMCTQTSAMPGGGIAAFLTACPSGWQTVPELAGRVLVASGNGYAAGDKGGSDSVTLTIEQMPAHQHGNGVLSTNRSEVNPGQMFAWGGRDAYGSNAAAHANSSGRVEGYTSKDGGGQPFDNRQAYYAVNYCRKL